MVTRISEPSFMTIHPTLVEKFQSKSQMSARWWSLMVEPDGGGEGKVSESPESVRFILWET